MFEFGDSVEFRISDTPDLWVKGTVFAVFRDGLIIIMVGSNFYDAYPKNIRKVSS